MPTTSGQKALRRLRALDRITLFCALPVGLLGVVVMAGWILRLPSLIQILPGLSPMMFNTAVGLVLGAASLPARSTRPQIVLVCGVLLVLLGGLTMVEYALGLEAGIDQLLLRDWHGGRTPGRMGFNSAGCLFVLGLSTMFRQTRANAQGILMLPTGIVLLSVSAAAALGYATGLEYTYAWGGTTRMALHTAGGFLLLGAGVFFSGWRQVGRGRRAWLAIGASGCIAGIVLVVSLGMMAEQRQTVAAQSRTAAANVAALMATHVDELLGALTRLDTRWAADCAAPCEQDVASYLRDFPELTRVGWVDQKRGTVAVFRARAAPDTGVEAETRDVALRLARKTPDRRSSRGGAVDIVVDPTGSELVVGRLGSASGPQLVATLDPVRLLRRSFLLTEGRAVALSIDGREIVGIAGASFDRGVFETTISGLVWRFRVSGGDPVRSHLPDLTLIAGTLIACFVGATVYLWQTSRERLTQNRALNADLQARYVEQASTKAELQSLLDAATQISIIATDATGIIRVFNTGAERMLQYAAREMVGVRTPELLHDPAECLERSRQLSLELGRPVEGPELFVEYGRDRPFDQREWTYIRKDGSRLDVNLVVTPVRTAGGALEGYLGIATDISARKLMEELLHLYNQQLAEQTRRAEEGNRAKSEFLATMSHEIRTPMNGVVGMTELLLLTELSTEQRDYADIVLKSADSLLTIINDILDFSKIESGKLQLEAIDFVLRTAIEEVAGLLAERAQSKGLEMACLIHHDLPVVVRGDPGRLRQILTNLLGNSIKFTQTGEVVLRAKLAASAGDAVTIRFEITDTGIGIAAEAQERLFQSFSQADGSTTRRFGGTGLGLAISKRLAELMGGNIGVQSEPGQGSTFWFTVNLSTIPEDHIVVPAPREDLRGVYALAVDDNQTNLQLVGAQTRAWGMVCDTTTQGSEALEMIAAAAVLKPYDVAILDMQMPGMDGLELARAIKSDASNAQMKVILMTSMAQRGHAARSEQVGIAGYLNKPVRQAELYDCLRTVTGTSARGSAPTAPPAAARMVTTHSLREAEGLRRTRVLIAEDNQTNQMAAVRLLEKLGYRVDVAVNGIEAVDACREVEYGIVLMDNQMPEMDGLSATREIRIVERARGRAPVPIIALTANAMQGDRERCLAAGMSDYLAKPFKLEQVRDLLRRWDPLVSPVDAAHVAVPAPSRDRAIDASVFDDFRGAGGANDFVTKLIDQYLAESAVRMAEMKDAVERRDAPALRLATHSLKGTSGTVGAHRLAALSEGLEHLARSATLDGAPALAAALEDEFGLVRDALLLEQQGAG